MRSGPLCIEPVEPAGPPIPDYGTEDVLTLVEQVRYVVALVQKPPTVVGPTWLQHVAADPAAVDKQLIDAQSRRIQAGRAHVFIKRKGPAQVRRWFHRHGDGVNGAVVRRGGE